MKRRFTILTAALALLAFLAIPMGMWGQTTVTWPGTTALPGTATAVANDQNVTIKTSSTNTYTNPIRIYANTTVTINALNGAKILSVAYEASSTGNYVTYAQNATVTPNVTPTVSGKIVTWTYAESANVTEFTFNPSSQTRTNGISITYMISGGGTPTTYTVTFNAGDGTFVGNTNFPNASNTVAAGTYTLPSATPASGYTFDGWTAAGISTPVTGSYTVSGDVDFTAHYSENSGTSQTLTFDVSSNPGNWPTTNSTTLTNYTYTLNGVDYTFALKNVKCNSGYLMMTSVAVLGLPAIEGYKLTKVVASNSSTCSTSVKVGISSSATQESYIAGGAIQTWSTTSSTYTYNLTATEPNTMYYLYVTNKNAQVLGLELTYEPDSSTPAPSISANNENITYDATSGSIAYTINNEPDPAGTLTASVPQNSWLTIGTVGATVPFTCTANPASAARTETVTLTYTYNTNETVTKEVTVTQAGNPNVVNLISDINAVNTNYAIRGTVVAVNARGCVVGDGTGYINFYNGYTAPSVAVGDMVRVSGNMTSHGNMYQFSAYNNVGLIEAATSSNYDETPNITIITEIPASYSSGLHLSDYFQFEGTLTKSDGYYYVAVGEGQINIAYPSTTQQNAMNALENKTVRIKGYFAGINSSNYFSVMMESIEEVPSTEPSVTVTPATISAPFGGADGTLAITYENLPDEFSFDYYFCDANGDELVDTDPNYPSWIDAEIQDGNDVYSVSYTIDANNGEARTAYFKVYTIVDEEEVYAIITVNQAQYVVDYAELPFVWEGGSKSDFLALNGVTAQGLGSDYAEGNAPYFIKLDGTGDYIQVKTNERPGKVTIGVKMIGGANTSTITIQGSADGETFTDVEELTISGAQNDELTLETTNTFATNVRYVKMLFTKGSNVGVGPITITKVYTKTINGYGDNSNPGGWYLIASPIGNVDPTKVTNMLSNNYDLFYFDHTKDNEWVNYKDNESGEGNESTNPYFDLEKGKGYLYANSETVELAFMGMAPTEEEVEVTLDYEASAEMPGWNLVGNPFAVTANIATQEGHTLYFYTLNAAGDEFVAATNTTIDPMEGVFVEAKVANEKITFTRGESAKGSLVALNLSNGRNIIDRAIVRFNECRPLHKLQLNKNHSKVYISMDGEDYAVVRGEEMGEMPVSFKAENNGSYTLSVNAEEVSFAYLHLIDNMTGNDVDLLQTPSYSFEAKTTDYESRFKLVFATGDNSNDDNFAFYSNGSFVINNEGNAELQVIDIMGRILKSESINGCANVSVNGAAGVYMLRLVNGDNVKVQKVVVK